MKAFKILMVLVVVLSLAAVSHAAPPEVKAKDGLEAGTHFQVGETGLAPSDLKTQATWYGYWYVSYIEVLTGGLTYVYFTDGSWVSFSDSDSTNLAVIASAAFTSGRPMALFLDGVWVYGAAIH